MPSGGIFDGTEWACPMCSNVNWAKRSECNVCQTAKPGVNLDRREVTTDPSYPGLLYPQEEPAGPPRFPGAAIDAGL